MSWKKSFPQFSRRRVRTAEKSLRFYPGGFLRGGADSLDYKPVEKAPLQYPTTPRERTEHEQTRPDDFGWLNGRK